MHKCAAFLLAENARCRVRGIERAHQMNLDDGLKCVNAHAVKDGIAQNASVVDDAIEPAE